MERLIYIYVFNYDNTILSYIQNIYLNQKIKANTLEAQS